MRERLTIHMGPMGSGKTTTLIDLVQRLGPNRCVTMCPSESVDTRNKGMIVKRCAGGKQEAMRADAHDLDELIGEPDHSGKVLVIDEYHLFHPESLRFKDSPLGMYGVQLGELFVHHPQIHVFTLNNLVDGYSHLAALRVDDTDVEVVLKYYGRIGPEQYHIKAHETYAGDSRSAGELGGDYMLVSEAVWLKWRLRATDLIFAGGIK